MYVRSSLLVAHHVNLIGLFGGLDDHLELLPQDPSRWYLTGLLVPTDAYKDQCYESNSPDEANLACPVHSVDGNQILERLATKRSCTTSLLPFKYPKQRNSCGLQLADLVARLIGRKCRNPDQDNRGYAIIKKKLLAMEGSYHDSVVKNLAKAVYDSSARQETAMKTLERTKRVTNAFAAYTQLLQRVFNEAATGAMQVDGFGLQPKPAKQLTPGGRALNALATIVFFDLACVMLCIARVGNDLRFLIHDSRREGEIEMPLFRRIFAVTCYLESCFGTSLPSLQYIVTTIKAPLSYCSITSVIRD
jgi:hypothetical protein